jgi:hypothetical protein
VQYELLPVLLALEGPFQRLEHRWRPTDLLYTPQVRALLRDIQDKYKRLEAARSELETLTRADILAKLLIRMRLYVRQAGYVWKMDQLAFIKAVASFYSDFGIVLYLLRREEATGRFSN